MIHLFTQAIAVFLYGIIILYLLYIILVVIASRKQYTLTCPYCGHLTTIGMSIKKCDFCHNIILFTCPLCNKEDHVDGYDMYDLLHNAVPVCKKCKKLDMRKAYTEYCKRDDSKAKLALDLLYLTLSSDYFKLITVVALILVIMDKVGVDSLLRIAVFVPFLLIPLAIIGYHNIQKDKKKYLNKA